MKQRIIGHMMVCNEERFVWYAIQSVLPYLDKLIVFDTGSKDRTMDLIRTIESSKLEVHQREMVDDKSHTALRNEMLRMSPADRYDWIMIVDGDEVWPAHQLEKTIARLGTTKAEVGVVRTMNVVGDVYHKLPESAGQYRILGYKGHLAMRFLRTKIKDLHVVNPHGGQSYMKGELPVLEQTKKEILVLPYYYLHATHLRRSSLDGETLKRAFKYKYELGEKVPVSQLPGVLFAERPVTVPEVTDKMSSWTYLISALMTFPRRLRRKLVRLKSGYI